MGPLLHYSFQVCSLTLVSLVGSPGSHFSLQRDAWMQTCSRAGLLLQSKCLHYRKSAVFSCVPVDAICHEELRLVRADGRWC